MRRLLMVGLLLATLAACGGDPAANPSEGASPSLRVEDLPALREFEAPGGDAVQRLRLEPVREHGTVCGPHYGFDVDASGALPAFDAAGFKPLAEPTAGVTYPVQAPDGYEFLVAHSPGKACAANPDAPAQRATGTLTIGGKPADITLPRAGGLVVVLVPKGYNASLDFKDGDQRFQLELRTGKASGAVEDFQPAASGKFSVTGYGGKSMAVAVGFTVTARLVSFVGDRGWAPKGRCWLRVRGEYLNQDIRQVTLPSWTAEQLFAVTGPAGKVPLTGAFDGGAIASSPYTQLPHTAWATVDAPCDKGQKLKVRVTPSGADVHLLNAAGGDLVLE